MKYTCRVGMINRSTDEKNQRAAYLHQNQRTVANYEMLKLSVYFSCLAFLKETNEQ